MQAVQGFYNKGVLTLDKKAPLDKARVVVVFPTEEYVIEKPYENEKMSTEEALRLFHSFTGSIDRDIDYEKEKDEYMNEKYGPFN